MMKSTILGVLAAVSLPALAFAALAPAEQAATVEPSQDTNPLVTVREAESRNGRGRDRDRGRRRP